MKHLITLALVLFAGTVFGQQQNQISSTLLQSIEKDVWVPFMEAYNESNSKKLKSIHSKDIVRVTVDHNQIETGEAYLDHFGGFVENVKERGGQLGIAFAILTTATNENGTLAHQTGYYRFSSKGPDDKALKVQGYGHFNVGLKKENGEWKIWLDSDARTDISHDDFNSQEIIYELEG
ncbi:YybH family protein [Flagellimonas nanhaiensis]|uniref:Nuclear transport factor 2 family protein n=1 Tax=Flagellimonas nanhaiensis TaxID=2292706 RepID=A0A371JUI5_9FLAO|nr:DUF4440 domain-containing protein [Allomuricauda nanhaiensis]RDY61473.1 nuclear transport factor 2 family protein [Allomuricauda nanhaiensis]